MYRAVQRSLALVPNSAQGSTVHLARARQARTARTVHVCVSADFKAIKQHLRGITAPARHVQRRLIPAPREASLLVRTRSWRLRVHKQSAQRQCAKCSACCVGVSTQQRGESRLRRRACPGIDCRLGMHAAKVTVCTPTNNAADKMTSVHHITYPHHRCLSWG